ncbi:hypothetical protein [Thermococcus sp.]|uniref:hypothetical protein n=1 Tax=Thermococcus sp. TaxID=35749 RepID=UPI0037421A46
MDSLNREPAIRDFLKNFNTYFGKTFEKVSSISVPKKHRSIRDSYSHLPFSFESLALQGKAKISPTILINVIALFQL